MKGKATALGTAGLALLALAFLVRIVFLNSGAAALGIAVLGLVLLVAYFFRAGRSVEGFMKRRSAREGGSLLGTSVFLIGIAVLVNLLASRFDWRLDVTEDRLNTLAPETVAALEHAPVPPEIWVFHPEDSAEAMRLRALLENAREADRRIRFHVVDPRREPALAARFGLRTYATVVAIGDRFETFAGAEEEDLGGAVLAASRTGKRYLGFLTGHGEIDPASAEPRGMRRASEVLDRRGFSPFRLDLLHGASLRDSVDAVVIAAPAAPLSAAEMESLRSFLDRGGRMLLLLDPAAQGNVDPLLARGGLRFIPRFLADPDQTDPQVLHPAEIASHPIVRTLRESRVQVVFPGAGEIEAIATPSGTQHAFLLRTGNRARVAGDPASEPRSRPLAAAAAWPGEDEGRMVVFGDADFATNAAFDALGNGDLLLAAVKWLAEPETQFALRPRDIESRPVHLGRQQGRALLILVVGLLPLGVLASGFAVWWRRR